MEITDGTEENGVEERMIRQCRRGKVKNGPFLNTLPILKDCDIKASFTLQAQIIFFFFFAICRPKKNQNKTKQNT